MSRKSYFYFIIFIVLISVLILIYKFWKKKCLIVTTKTLFGEIEIIDLKQLQNINETSHSKNFGVKNMKEFRSFNPTVSFFNNEPIFIHRLSNFTFCNDIDHKGVSGFLGIVQHRNIKNFIAVETGSGDITDIILPDSTLSNCVKGFEDPRSIILNEKLFILANQHTGYNCKPQMWLSSFALNKFAGYNIVTNNFNTNNIDNNIMVKSVGPETSLSLHINFDKELVQKNWMPFVKNNILYFIYSVNPHIILQCDLITGNCIKIAETINDKLPKNIRGGSQARFYDNEFYTITHKKDDHKYSTQIYKFSSEFPFQITGISDDFMFNDKENTDFLKIQFVSGFDINNDIAYITYGEQDCHSKLCKISMKQIIKQIKNI